MTNKSPIPDIQLPPLKLKRSMKYNKVAKNKDKLNSFYYFDPKIESHLLSKDEFHLAKLKIIQLNRDKQERKLIKEKLRRKMERKLK